MSKINIIIQNEWGFLNLHNSLIIFIKEKSILVPIQIFHAEPVTNKVYAPSVTCIDIKYIFNEC